MTLPDDASKLPILPEIVQNRTGADISPATPPPVPCAVTPVPPATPAPVLSTRQLNAIPLILAGLTDEQVAVQVGVQRQAVNRWRNQHPRFIAELNRQRSLAHADTLDRYDRILNRALGHIERFQQLDPNSWLNEQVQLATRVLRATSRRTLARDPAAPPPPTDPNEIALHLLSQGLDPSPDDSPADDAPPLPPPAPTKSSR